LNHTSKELSKKKIKELWKRVFGLKVGDRVRVNRTLDPLNIPPKGSEGVITGILDKYQSSHHGSYMVEIKDKNGMIAFCRVEELEKIEDSEED